MPTLSSRCGHGHHCRKPQTPHDAESRGIPIYVVKSNTVVQLEQSLLSMRHEKGGDPVVAALEEAEEAIGRVINEDSARDLNPRTPTSGASSTCSRNGTTWTRAAWARSRTGTCVYPGQPD